eukprot:CAMPEP_0177663242 /NCGR_PEP_ID=MMETSP0447-20121125/19802_1 /TAXON_ID=0 /ORGANISM="Stygamoeba regulata, Strain BSH-02190019" /LENGTH=280 /DNA_ID=CAMNT_0019169027 /DNA_START=56 /DNA_END=898 /DNA_ORIENTATION=+
MQCSALLAVVVLAAFAACAAADSIVPVSPDFINFRGSFRMFHLLNIGAQTSLVRLASGRFVLLDSYVLNDEAMDLVNSLTNNGADIEAVINLHPFHTTYCAQVAEQFPQAKLYGTQRHRDLYPNLPWEKETTDSPAFHALYSNDFLFSVPRGVDFVSDNENVHFSSVLAYHKASRTIHVDDTYMFVDLPGVVKWLGIEAKRVLFHPALSFALQKRKGAAQDFRDWATQVSHEWELAANLCAAHTATLLAEENDGDLISTRMRAALEAVEGTLKKHEDIYG